MKKLFASLFAAACAIVLSVPANAADFPTRNINCMNPYLAGGIIEVATRPVLEEMSKHLPKTIAMTNHAGAGGVNGLTKFIKERPDGYTITVCSDMTLYCLSKFRDVRFNAEKDFVPIGSWAVTNTAMIVKRGDPRFQTFKEFMAYAAAHRDQTLSLGMIGKLSLRHAVLAQLLSMVDLPNVKLVPFGGDLDVINALGGGHIDGGVTDNITSELTIPIGFFGKTPCPYFPDVPTFASMGYDIDMAGSYVLWAHKDTPADQLKVLRDALKASWDAEAVKETAKKLGMNPLPMFDEELDAKIAKVSKALDELIAKGIIVPEKKSN